MPELPAAAASVDANGGAADAAERAADPIMPVIADAAAAAPPAINAETVAGPSPEAIAAQVAAELAAIKDGEAILDGDSSREDAATPQIAAPLVPEIAPLPALAAQALSLPEMIPDTSNDADDAPASAPPTTGADDADETRPNSALADLADLVMDSDVDGDGAALVPSTPTAPAPPPAKVKNQHAKQLLKRTYQAAKRIYEEKKRERDQLRTRRQTFRKDDLIVHSKTSRGLCTSRLRQASKAAHRTALEAMKLRCLDSKERLARLRDKDRLLTSELAAQKLELDQAKGAALKALTALQAMVPPAKAEPTKPTGDKKKTKP